MLDAVISIGPFELPSYYIPKNFSIKAYVHNRKERQSKIAISLLLAYQPLTGTGGI